MRDINDKKYLRNIQNFESIKENCTREIRE